MSVFESRQQLNAVSKLVSKTFDIKLEKVKHKLSLQEGFKNVNALASTLPDLAPTKESTTEKPLKTLDHFGEDFLMAEVECEFINYDKNNQPTLIHLCAPRAIKMMFEGYVFTSEKWLTRWACHLDYLEEWEDPISFLNYDGNTTRQINLSFSIDDEKLEEEYRYIFHIGTLQAMINKEYAITDLNILKSNPSLLSELLCVYNIPQYNFIVDNHKAFKFNKSKKTNLIECYLGILNCHFNSFDDYDNDFEAIFYLINVEGAKISYSNFEEKVNTLKSIKTPPFMFYEKSIDSNCCEESIVTTLIEGFFSITGEQFTDTDFSPIIKNIDVLNKNQTFTVEDESFFNHVSFCANIMSKQLIDQTPSEYLSIDFPYIIEISRCLDIDETYFNKAMLTVPKNDILEHYCDCVDEKYKDSDYSFYKNWHNLPFVVWLLTTKIGNDADYSELKLFAELLFENLNEETLNTSISLDIFVFPEYFEELYSVKNIRDLLTCIIKKG